jgi:hypothetical protein
LLVAVAGVLGSAGLLAPVAAAGPLVQAAQGCEPAWLSKPFHKWLDPMNYTPVVDGGFEKHAKGWTLTRGAQPVAGNEPWKVAGETDQRSLALPEGASATTPPICVGLAEPTLRFFARSSASLVNLLEVEVLFEDAAGTVHALPIGVDLGGGWHPSLVMPVVANLLPLMPGEQTPVAFRFTALQGDFQLDDVYVDPWCMR